jgi:transcriptional regulator with XRE-family HTH domain
MDTAKPATSLAAKRIGRYVRERRLALGLSRAQLARRLGFVLGSVVSHVERGSSRIAPNALANWAHALEMDPGAFSRDMARLGHGTPAALADEHNTPPLPHAVWA